MINHSAIAIQFTSNRSIMVIYHIRTVCLLFLRFIQDRYSKLVVNAVRQLQCTVSALCSTHLYMCIHYFFAYFWQLGFGNVFDCFQWIFLCITVSVKRSETGGCSAEMEFTSLWRNTERTHAYVTHIYKWTHTLAGSSHRIRFWNVGMVKKIASAMSV